MEARAVERLENLKCDEQFQCPFYKEWNFKNPHTCLHMFFQLFESTRLIQISKFPENELMQTKWYQNIKT